MSEESTEQTIEPDKDHSSSLKSLKDGATVESLETSEEEGSPVEYRFVVEPFEVLGCRGASTFRADRYYPLPSAMSSLAGIASLISDHASEGKALLFGHADSGEADAEALSERRAKAIHAALLGDVEALYALDQEDGSELFVVQELCGALGHDAGPVDGINGPLTQAGVESFQEAAGGSAGPVDGIAGVKTRKGLFTEYVAQYSVDCSGSAFIDPPAVGIGSAHLLEESEEAFELNRRVVGFMFKEPRLPPDPVGDYERIKGHCGCENGEAVGPMSAGDASDAAEDGAPTSETDEDAPTLEIMKEGAEEPAPEVVDVDVVRTIEAVVTASSTTGSYAWASSADDKLELTPDEADPTKCTVKGLTETAEDEQVSITCTLTPEGGGEPVEQEHQVKVQKRTVELFFQKSTGIPSGDDRGIQGLSFRTLSEGEVVQEGTTEADGKALISVVGDSVTVELLHEGSPVASYEVSTREDDPEDKGTLSGQQRRLRMLGYHLGHAGADGNGVDGAMGKRSDRAILDFQISADLDHDGIAGSNTQAKLSDEAGGD